MATKTPEPKPNVTPTPVPSPTVEEAEAPSIAPQEQHGASGSWGAPMPAEDVPAAAPPVADVPSIEPAQTSRPMPAAPASAAPSMGLMQAEPPPPTVAEHLAQQSMHFDQDMGTGKIHPKTIQDLFAEKSTLGKAATIFGLLIGGAGAGLTRQPNALLELMQKDIQADLEAQKQNINNQQNLYKLNLEHQMQAANMYKMDVDMARQGKESTAQIAHLDAQTKNQVAEAKIRAATATTQQMNTAYLNKLADDMEKLPDGSPQKQKAQATWAALSEIVKKENYVTLPMKAMAQIALVNSLNPHGAPGSDPEDTWKARQRQLVLSGKKEEADYNEEHHIPGVPGVSSVKIDKDDRAVVRDGLHFQEQMQRLIDFTNKHKGVLPDSLENKAIINQGKALAAQALSAYQKAHAGGGVYKEGEADFIRRIIPEDPTALFGEVRVIPQLAAAKAETAHYLDSHLKSIGFREGYQGANQDSSNTGGSGPPQGAAPGALWLNPQTKLQMKKVHGGWIPVTAKGKT